MAKIQESEKALKALASLLPVVYSALEAATQSTREFFDREDRPIDSYLAPCLVRYYAKQHLDSVGQSVEYDREELSNNGLCLTYNNYLLRIWKSEDGELPVPGQSRPRQAFFQQLPIAINNPEEQLNLAILWEVSSDYNLQRLLLSCPKAGDTTRASVEAYWTIPIPHPALSSPPQSQIDVNEVADLDITRIKPLDLEAEQAR
jgi:hypothetical protein